MEKAIKLVMCTDKSIKVLVNGEEKHKIEAENRSISAEAIYKMIGFSAGDHILYHRKTKLMLIAKY